MVGEAPNIVNNMTNTVKEAGGNFLSSIVNAPLQFLKGAISSPFHAIGGIFKGIYNNTIGNLFGLLVSGGAITAVTQFAPDLLAWLPLKIGDKKVGELMAEHAREGGMSAIMKDSLIGAVAVNAAMGAASGAVSGAMDGAGGANTSTAEKVGGGAGALFTVAGLGMLVFSAVKSNNIGYAGSDDASPKTPDALPHTGNTPKAAQKS